MKLSLCMLALIFSACATANAPTLSLVRILEINHAVQRDEMFNFHFTYSAVRIDQKSLYFTANALHEELLGSYKIVMNYTLPLDKLRTSTREVKTNEGIGKNTFVLIHSPSNDAFHLVASSVMTSTDGEGKVEKKSWTEDKNEVILPFETEDMAEVWNRDLTQYLESPGQN